jgi:carbamoylphosphate synthase large subunit
MLDEFHLYRFNERRDFPTMRQMQDILQHVEILGEWENSRVEVFCDQYQQCIVSIEIELLAENLSQTVGRTI